MVISKNGKRKRKEAAPAVVNTPAVTETAPVVPTTPEVPKRTKVHAQRKFAQGQGCSSSYSSTAQSQQSTPNKDVPARNETPTEILPNIRPNTEDFLTFLCFRGTPVLPSHLDYFNTNNAARAAAAAEAENAKQMAVGRVATSTVSSSSTSKVPIKPLEVTPVQRELTPPTVSIPQKSDRADAEKSTEHFIPFAVRKQAETVSDGKRRQAVQALKKKYQEQRIAKTQVQNLTKAAQMNRVTRSGGTIDEIDLEETSTKLGSTVEPPSELTSITRKTLRNKMHTATATEILENVTEASSPPNVSLIKRCKSVAASVADSCDHDSVRTSETASKKPRGKSAKIEINHMPTRLTRQHASAYPESYRLAEEAELKSIQMTAKDSEKGNSTPVDNDSFSSDDDRPLVKTVFKNSPKKNKASTSTEPPPSPTKHGLLNPIAPAQPEKGIFEASPEPLEEMPTFEDYLISKKKINPVKKVKLKRRTTSVEQSDELKIIIKTTAESVDSASMASNEAPFSKKIFPSSTAKSSNVNDVGSVASDDALTANKQTKRNLPTTSKSCVVDEPFKFDSTLAAKKKRRNEFTDLVQHDGHGPDAGPVLSDTRAARPSRKTKEAAAIYMELIGQKLNFDDFDEDNGSMDSFPELPNVRKTQKMENELKANVGKERTSSQNSAKTINTLKNTRKTSQGKKNDSDDAESTQQGFSNRKSGVTAKRKMERKSSVKTSDASNEYKGDISPLEKSFSESDEEPLAIKLTKKDDQSSVPDVISVSSKTDENVKDMLPCEPLFPPPQTPQRRQEEPRTPSLKSPSAAYNSEHQKLPSPSHMLPKYEPPKQHPSLPNPSPPMGYPRTPSYQPSPFKTPGDHSNMLSPSINISPMASSKDDSRTLKSPPPQSPNNQSAVRSPTKNSNPGAQGLQSPGGTSTQSVSAILANLMPSKEESGKIFGIASVTLAQSSGPNDTKCTLGKCGSVHKPPLGPVVPTESFILNDQMSSKERRKAKVNMTHDQIQRWLTDCSFNQEIVDDLSGLDLTSPLTPIYYKDESSPSRDESEHPSTPTPTAPGNVANKLSKAPPTRSPIRNPAKDSPKRNTLGTTASKQGPITKAKAAQIQTVTKDDYVAYNKMFDERNNSRLNTPITVSPSTVERVSNATPDNSSGKSAEVDIPKANENSKLEAGITKSSDNTASKSKGNKSTPATSARSTEKPSPVKVSNTQPLSSPISSKTPTATFPQTPTASSPIERKTPIYNPKRTPVYNTKTIDIPGKSKAIVNTFGAFSPENEASIYSFDKDDDFSAFSTPFVRNRGNENSSVKSEKFNSTQSKAKKAENNRNSAAIPSTSVTPTLKKEVSLTLGPDENAKCASIAVEVNMDPSTLPKSKPSEGNESDPDAHTFYIPLQGTNITGSKSDQLIQGVAVKLGTEGPDGPNQRVIMHAKLVTKAQMGSNTTPIPESLGNVQEIVKSLMANKEAAKMVPVGTVQPRFKSSDNLNDSSSPQLPSGSGMNQCSSSSLQQLQKNRQTQKQNRFKSEAAIQPSNNTAFPRHDDPAQMVEAPVFRPTEKEFADPMEFFDRISPIAARFGLCRVIPPASFKPECKISDDMRFTSYNQYVHKMLHRWGPSAKEFSAIKKYLATQSVQLIHPPYIGGMEVDLPRLYHTVQELGGLREVIEKKKWSRVAEEMCFPKTAQDRVSKLDDIYCKYLLPYDTLSSSERQKLFDEVEADWAKTEAKARRNADRNLSDVASNEDDDEDDDSENEEEEEDGGSMECIVEGRKMPLKQFFRIARNTMALWFKNTEPSSSEIEAEYWRHVAVRDSHVCVHSGSIDSSGWGYGFPTPGPKAKGSTCGKNPWNLKVLTNNHGSILRSIGPVTGVTVPTLHVGMLFSACCWYRDPHGLPWIEYLHTGGSKIWYGVPDEQSANFRSAFTSLVPTHCQNKTVWLPCDTAMVPPHMLTDRGVSLCRAEQEPGQFVIVFPRAYTSSLGTGYTISESVYFATNNWLDTAKGDFKDIHDSCEPTMFSLEQLLFAVAQDTRSNCETLEMVLPMMNEVYDREVTERNLIQLAGVSNTEKVPVKGSKKTATTSPLSGGPGQPSSASAEDPECESCRANVYLSWIQTEQDAVYCLQHGLKHINSGRLGADQCRLVHTYSIEDVEQLISRIRSRTTGSPPTAVQSITSCGDGPSAENQPKAKKPTKLTTNKRK